MKKSNWFNRVTIEQTFAGGGYQLHMERIYPDGSSQDVALKQGDIKDQPTPGQIGEPPVYQVITEEEATCLLDTLLEAGVRPSNPVAFYSTQGGKKSESGGFAAGLAEARADHIRDLRKIAFGGDDGDDGRPVLSIETLSSNS